MTISNSLNGRVIRPGEGRNVRAFGSEIDFMLSGDHTGGSLVIGIATVPVGNGPPMHVHQDEDEVFLIIEGEYRILSGGRVDDGRPGCCRISAARLRAHVPGRRVEAWQALGANDRWWLRAVLHAKRRDGLGVGASGLCAFGCARGRVSVLIPAAGIPIEDGPLRETAQTAADGRGLRLLDSCCCIKPQRASSGARSRGQSHELCHSEPAGEESRPSRQRDRSLFRDACDSSLRSE